MTTSRSAKPPSEPKRDRDMRPPVRPVGPGFVSFVVDAQGSVTEVRLAGGHDDQLRLPRKNLFETWSDKRDIVRAIQAAINGTSGVAVGEVAERQWTFHCVPQTRNDQPAALCVIVPVSFDVLGQSLAIMGGLFITADHLGKFMQAALAETAKALRLDFAATFELGADGRMRLMAGWPPKRLADLELPEEDSVERQVLESGEAYRSSGPRVAAHSSLAKRVDPKIDGIACMPITTGGRVQGVLCAYTTGKRAFGEQEAYFLDFAAFIFGQAVAKIAAMDAQARLTAVIDATTDLVVLAKPDGQRFYANPAARRLLGLKDDADITRTRIGDRWPEWATNIFYERALPIAKERGIWTGESAILAKDGSEVPVSQVVIAHRNGDGDVDQLSVIGRDISEIKQYQAQIQAAAEQDPLTGLANRRRFLAELERAVRHDASGALLYIDLDDFKAINDTLGHAAGDKFLVQFTNVLKERLRSTDLLARLGGDEFAVLLENVSKDEALAAGDRILQAVRGFQMHIRNRVVRTTASIGIAMFSEHGTFVDELLTNSDLAMYRAKDNGRNNVVLYDADYGGREVSSVRLHWRQRIPDALANDRFTFYAQPIVDLATRRVAQYELLLRIRDSRGRVTRPATFLEIAETSGLIHDIDHWVVHRAIRVASEMQEMDLPFQVSANLSGKALANEELLEQIKREIVTSNTSPERICFEITETAAVNNLIQAQAFLKALKGLGFRLALDDFGVGFSSFAQLRNLPIDYIKIDGAFISSLPSNKNDQHFVKAIADVVRSLGIGAVAEFVGSEETIQMLKSYGVDYGQGYYLGRPVPLATVFRQKLPKAA